MHLRSRGLRRRPSGQVRGRIGERVEAAGSTLEQKALPFALPPLNTAKPRPPLPFAAKQHRLIRPHGFSCCDPTFVTGRDRRPRLGRAVLADMIGQFRPESIGPDGTELLICGRRSLGMELPGWCFSWIGRRERAGWRHLPPVRVPRSGSLHHGRPRRRHRRRMRWHGERGTGTPDGGSRCRPNDRAVEHGGTAGVHRRRKPPPGRTRCG
jgi:hypothetical protein